METKKAINFYGSFEGIYEWGRGYISREASEKWNRFWKEEFPKLANYHWSDYIEGKGIGECGRLVGLSQVIYMHPLAFYGTWVAGGVSCSVAPPKEEYEYKCAFYGEVPSLIEICKACAKYCGGTFKLECTPEFEIETPSADIVIKDKDDYIHKCAEKVLSTWR